MGRYVDLIIGHGILIKYTYTFDAIEEMTKKYPHYQVQKVKLENDSDRPPSYIFVYKNICTVSVKGYIMATDDDTDDFINNHNINNNIIADIAKITDDFKVGKFVVISGDY